MTLTVVFSNAAFVSESSATVPDTGIGLPVSLLISTEEPTFTVTFSSETKLPESKETVPVTLAFIVSKAAKDVASRVTVPATVWVAGKLDIEAVTDCSAVIFVLSKNIVPSTV